MALILHQAYTQQQQQLVKQKDLDCMVNYMGKFILAEDHLLGCKFIFKWGMPGQFPNGEWGFTFSGDVGMHTRPVPKELDWRVSYRYGTIPEYEIKFKGLYEVIAPITDYYHKNYLELKDPNRIIERHLRALQNSIPNYLNYLVYKMFVGTEKAKEKWYIKTWYERYIEPTDGAQNGYPFYLSGGHGVVNLSEAQAKNKVTQHRLKTDLENINKALRNETRKIEVDVAKNEKLKTDWPKVNLTETSKRTFALYMAMVEFAEDVKIAGVFPDIKYKHKNDEGYWKDWMPRVSESPLIALFDRKSWNMLVRDWQMSNPVTKFEPPEFPGTFILTDLMDGVKQGDPNAKAEGLILQEDLIQCWILPQLSKYSWQPYPKPGENTRDFIYELGHTIDKLDIFCSAWFKLK